MEFELERKILSSADRRTDLGLGNHHPFSSVIACDAANVVLDALARRQGQQGVKETVLTMRHFEGVQEPIIFNEFGDMKRGLFVAVVRDGQFVATQ
ncbi:MAG: hypothetical protein H6974_07005 [Gammaproteobacteria bacterium]|nr:hypothetical protein [Gammaproteobacteria bacterium]MCP5196521.1 hypothetical protein [Gammaproteobacteria bacterium]